MHIDILSLELLFNISNIFINILFKLQSMFSLRYFHFRVVIWFHIIWIKTSSFKLNVRSYKGMCIFIRFKDMIVMIHGII